MELYFKNLSLRYRQATKKEKGKMLDEYCATSGHSRKHAIKVINNYKKRRTMPNKKKKDNRGREPIYTSPALIRALKNIWLASDQMCGKRLAPVIEQWLVHYDKHYQPLDEELTLSNQRTAIIERTAALVDEPPLLYVDKIKSGNKNLVSINSKIKFLQNTAIKIRKGQEARRNWIYDVVADFFIGVGGSVTALVAILTAPVSINVCSICTVLGFGFDLISLAYKLNGGVYGASNAPVETIINQSTIDFNLANDYLVIKKLLTPTQAPIMQVANDCVIDIKNRDAEQSHSCSLR